MQADEGSKVRILRHIKELAEQLYKNVCAVGGVRLGGQVGGILWAVADPSAGGKQALGLPYVWGSGIG